MITHAVVFLHSDGVLGRIDAEVFEPTGFDVETARAIFQCSAIPVLTLFTEKPVDENLRGVWMRRVFDHAEHAEAVARRQPFLRRWYRLERQTGVDKRTDRDAAETEGDGEFRLSQRIGQLARIPR